jgi:hypothetical protein
MCSTIQRTVFFPMSFVDVPALHTQEVVTIAKALGERLIRVGAAEFHFRG